MFARFQFLFRFALIPGVVLGLPTLASAADGVSSKPYTVFEVAGIPVTNSMIMGWLISIALILAVRFAVGSPKLIPSKGQAVVESVVLWVRDLIEPIVGQKMVKPVFPLLLTFFVFILIHNWSGLIPGVGTIGYYEGGKLTYFFRPANADLNMTLALALIHFGAWLYFVLRYAGVGTLMYDLFGNKADRKEIGPAIYVALFFIFFAVGIIEVVSILLRPISLSFRLFGNVFGGENLLTNITAVAEPILGVLIPVPFYFLEILIGAVQALVFTLLVAVYIGLICNHGDEEHAH
jgi:F-type H+-transporting ATPase subunit a